MKEQAPKYESLNDHESLSSHEIEAKTPEVDKVKAEKEQSKKLEQSRDEAEKLASSNKALAVEKDQPKNNYHPNVHSALKKDTYKQLLGEIRQRLPRNKRAFSKFIHNKNVEAVSDISAKTVARPSGLLGGGLGALFGSILLLRYSSHYGFKYNYSFFLFTFAAGFLIGLIIEVLLKLVKRRS